MASKREPCISESLNIFKDVIKRSLLENFIFMNKMMISVNTKDKYSVILMIEDELWNQIINDDELKPHIIEFDPLKSKDPDSIKRIFSYENDINSNDWINLDCEQLYAGKVMKISLNDIEYDIPICKTLIPLKLKKAEYNNISYKIISGIQTVLMLKKKFEYPLEKCGFSIVRIFYIL